MNKTTARGTGAELFEARYETLAGRLLTQAPAWQRDFRQYAFDRVMATGLPTRRTEGWRHVNLEPLRQMTFPVETPGGGPSGSAASAVNADAAIQNALARLDAPESKSGGPSAQPRAGVAKTEAARLVFVNGRFRPGLSRVDSLPDGAVVMALAEALADDEAGRLEAFLGQAVSWTEHPFATLNAALFADGLFLELPAGVAVEQPIHVVHLSGGSASTAAIASHPRGLILLGAGARASVVETFASLGGPAYVVNAVTEAVLGEGSALDYAKLQSESREGGVCFHALAARLLANGKLRATALTAGGRVGRDDVIALLDGEGADATLNGLYLAGGEQNYDACTLLDHARSHGRSRQSYRGVLGGRASANFRGKVLVRPDAQKTDAVQACKNLLLSGAARGGVQPQLEIYADDVKCTHGATVGRLSEESLFYAQSRGLSPAEARSMLTLAFAADALADVADAPTRDRMRREIEAWLNQPGLAEAAS